MAVVYSGLVKILANVSPVRFFKDQMSAMVFAFASASSVGTLPVNMECSKKLGVSNEVSSFVLPLGATINMDGTSIYMGVCSIFIAQVFGIDLTIGQQFTIVLTAVLASIGTAGVPGSGMIMLAMVLQSVGLPVEGIALVAGVDRILDMMRTTVNITGDQSCAVCVDAMERRKAERKAVKAGVGKASASGSRLGIPKTALGYRSPTAHLRLAMCLAPSLHFRRKSIFEAQRVLKNAGPASARFFRLVCEFVW